MRTILLLHVIVMLASDVVFAQASRLPVIDMHFHAVPVES